MPDNQRMAPDHTAALDEVRRQAADVVKAVSTESRNLQAFISDRAAAVEEVRRQAADVVRTVSAESRQLQEEMAKLAVTLQADVSKTLAKLETRLLSLESRSEHHSSRKEMAELAATSEAGIGDRFEKLECHLLDLESRWQRECSREEESCVPEQTRQWGGKDCDSLHSTLATAIKESQAALRVEFAEHCKTNGETTAAIHKAHTALREEFANHKAGVEDALGRGKEMHDDHARDLHFLQEQNKALREEIEERFGKVCDGLRINLETALREAHEGLRIELAEYKKSSMHATAAMQHAHAALQVEFANHKDKMEDVLSPHKERHGNHVAAVRDISIPGAEEEISTSLSPKSFHTSFDSADEEGVTLHESHQRGLPKLDTRISPPQRHSFGIAADDACGLEEPEGRMQTPRATAEGADESQAKAAGSPRTQWFQLDDDSHKEDSNQSTQPDSPTPGAAPLFQAAVLEAEPTESHADVGGATPRAVPSAQAEPTESHADVGGATPRAAQAKPSSSPDRRTQGASEELAAKLNKMNDRIRKAQQSGQVDEVALPESSIEAMSETEEANHPDFLSTASAGMPEVSSTARALPALPAIEHSTSQLELGCTVRVKRSGRQGNIIVLHIHDELPYKVRFNDGELPFEDWFTQDGVEVHSETVDEAKSSVEAEAMAEQVTRLDEQGAVESEIIVPEVEAQVATMQVAPPPIEVGCAVRVKRTGRQGVLLLKHDDDLPYKVRFTDGEAPLQDWLPKDSVELLPDTAEEAQALAHEQQEEQEAKTQAAGAELAEQVQRAAAAELNKKEVAQRRPWIPSWLSSSNS